MFVKDMVVDVESRTGRFEIEIEIAIVRTMPAGDFDLAADGCACIVVDQR